MSDIPQEVLFRKLVYGLADGTGEESLTEAVEMALQRVEDLEQENEELREELAEAKRQANNALGVAKASDNGVRADGNPSKTDKARLTARNEVVKRALIDRSSTAGGGVTVNEVQQMCRPETDVAYQIVKNAFTSLAEKWPAFQVGDNESGKRALRLQRDAMTEDLVGAVEADLGRDDLTKRFLSRRSKEGGR